MMFTQRNYYESFLIIVKNRKNDFLTLGSIRNIKNNKKLTKSKENTILNFLNREIVLINPNLEFFPGFEQKHSLFLLFFASQRSISFLENNPTKENNNIICFNIINILHWINKTSLKKM